MKNRHVAASCGLALSAIALCGLIAIPGHALAEGAAVAAQKDETVYVHAAADGTVKSTEVTTVLKNPDGAAELSDFSNLADIEGEGGATYAGSGPSIIWNADGEDVTYTGSTSAEAPVSVRVSYTLDGSPIDPGQLAGKSGHVTIRYDFENHSSATATVRGAQQSVYTPFTCITALMLDGKDFKNVEVENGKVISDGDDVIVAGYAMPGLKQSLGSMADDADVPDHCTVAADVTDFELKSSMTIVTAGLMSDIDTESLGVSNLDDASALTDAMGQLINGSEQLTSGLSTLADSLKELEAGTQGIQAGAETLSGGLYLLAGDSGLGYLGNGADALASAIGLIAESSSTMKAKLQEASDSLEGISDTDVFSGALDLLREKESALGDEAYQSLRTALETAKESAATAGVISAGLAESAKSVDTLTASATELKEKASGLAGGIYAASSTASDLADGAATLESYAEQLNQAVPALAQGARSAADGSNALTQGMQAFNDQGVSQLVNTLQNDYGGLLDRMNALSDAAKSYANFGGITPGTTGSVKFVIETDGITRQS